MCLSIDKTIFALKLAFRSCKSNLLSTLLWEEGRGGGREELKGEEGEGKGRAK